jgi:hypothetical protein
MWKMVETEVVAWSSLAMEMVYAVDATTNEVKSDKHKNYQSWRDQKSET